ncbi:hypothetical protein B0T22DRAFT_524276 [Podospora appendiculata]|uniref:CorA-like transporter domain-containing protein n=1 Tax=Podospora appendiculata TaxID=314037 RepID=A0AAE0WYJ2_9PEZI|nr:hypothetical protein B0T22DRAFT_524276 [Podospora appendiculata]
MAVQPESDGADDFSFKKALFFLQSPLAQELYHQKAAAKLFETEEAKSRINVLTQLPISREKRHSNSRVQITQPLFECLLEECGVFPRFREHMAIQGRKEHRDQIGPPAFSFSPFPTVNQDPIYGSTIHQGDFECAYTLRYAEFTNRPDNEPWSVRQLTIYQKHVRRVQTVDSQWILVTVKSDSSTKKIMEPHTTSELLRLYRHHQVPSDDASESASANKLDPVVPALRKKTEEVEYTRKQAEALRLKYKSIRKLTRAPPPETVKKKRTIDRLAVDFNLEARRENAATFKLIEKCHRDSASLKILSIITLIYLPSTIVSSFYSTQFVRQNTVGEKVTISCVGYSQNWWLFFAISLSLAILTVGVWYSWSNYLYDLDVASILAGWGRKIKGQYDHLRRQRSSKTKSPSEEAPAP